MTSPPPEPTPDDVRRLHERIVTSGPLESLEEVLAEPPTEAYLLDILAQRLGAPLTRNTWQEVHEGFGKYIGERDVEALEPADLLVMAANAPAAQFHVLVDGLAPRPNVLKFIRLAVSKFGPEIAAAYEIWNELANDWRVIRPRVFREFSTGQVHFQFDVEKYGGDTVFIEGNATSVLNLVSSLVSALRNVPDDTAFDGAAAATFLGEAQSLVERLQDVSGGTGDDESLASRPAGQSESG